MIKVITNNLGSCDWVIVKDNADTLFEGHSVSTLELASLLEQLGHEVDLVQIDDEQMEEGAY